MKSDSLEPLVSIYSTCPQSKDVERATYAQRVREVSRWSEAAGCRGILVYTDNGIVDPWLTSQLVIESTEVLRPLVAVQPVYMHPYSAAKMVASLAHLHGRAVDLNLLAGGFRNDLLALGDAVEHDDRYARTVEYGTILRRLVEEDGPVSFSGRFYSVTSLRLSPTVDAALFPNLLISGSSPAGLAAARELRATAIKYPQPADEELSVTADDDLEYGVRIGVIAREDPVEAWTLARARFPEDRRGQLAHKLAMRVSDSHWHRELSGQDVRDFDEVNPYWLEPFKNYGTFCPYLVGSYDVVAAEIAKYLALGFRSFITDIPQEEDDLAHLGVTIARAREIVRA